MAVYRKFEIDLSADCQAAGPRPRPTVTLDGECRADAGIRPYELQLDVFRVTISPIKAKRRRLTRKGGNVYVQSFIHLKREY